MRVSSGLTVIILVLGFSGSGYASPASELNERGIAHGQRGEYQRALESFNKAIDLDPTVSDYFMNRGLIYYLRGQHRPAIADLDQAIRLDPGNAVALFNRGSVYDDVGEPDRALEDYGNAIRLKPSHPGPYRNRAVTYMRRGEFQPALADLDRAITLDPTYPAAYLTRACLHAVTERADRAEIDYAKARQLAPRQVPELPSASAVGEVACRNLGGVSTRTRR
jgi:tetratricopeptide (TPR) repeat protein